MNALMKPIEQTVAERAANALSKAETEIQIKALVEESKPIVAVTDPASRAICHGSLMTLKNMRVLIQTRAKEGRDEAVKYSKAVISIEKELVALIEPEETRLAAIRDEWDSIKQREKEAAVAAEIARSAEIQRQIDGIRNWPLLASGKTSEVVHLMLISAQSFPVSDEVFQERIEEAKSVLGVSIAALTGILAERKAHEAAQEQLKRDQEELAQLRAADAERERVAKIETDRVAKEAHDKQVADARAHAEQIRKDREENDRIAEEQRQANAAEAGRIAAARETLEREQKALLDAQKKPEPVKTSVRTVERPTATQIVALVSQTYQVSTVMAAHWLRAIKIELEEAA